jgi:hypothetical protein
MSKNFDQHMKDLESQPNIYLDDFHYHEAYDRLSVIVDMLDTYVLKHQAVQNDPQSRAMIKEAQSLLMDTYSRLATRMYNYGKKSGKVY